MGPRQRNLKSDISSRSHECFESADCNDYGSVRIIVSLNNTKTFDSEKLNIDMLEYRNSGLISLVLETGMFN